MYSGKLKVGLATTAPVHRHTQRFIRPNGGLEHEPVGSKMRSLSASALRWTASFHAPSYVDCLIQVFQYWTVA